MPRSKGPGRAGDAAEAGGDWAWTDARLNTASSGPVQLAPNAVTALALGYARRGWRVLPIPRGQKKPAINSWPNFVVTMADIPPLFCDGKNIAVRLGRASGELVDLDLDCAEAMVLADLYLPQTSAEFGRASKPRSHRLYIAPGAIFESFSDPISGEMIVELRADGREGGAHLSLFPPSIADSERREWCGEVIAPAAVETPVLRRRTAYLAIACLLARYVSEHAARRPGPDLPRLLWEFDHELGRPAYRWLGQPDPDQPQDHPRPRNGLPRRDLEIVDVVQAIHNDCDWIGWNNIGMAIFGASDGSEDGFVVLDAFSARSSKYDPAAVRERWRNYRRSPPSRIGMGSLVHLARQCGWTPPSRSKAG
jgi:Primase C terminal 2 (PriCT-2)/Bifunctional DNA primase/polymerase, N-terminal